MEKTYQTRNLLTADADGTRVIRTKGNSDGELGYITVFADTAHTINFYDGEDNTGDLIFTKPASLAVGTYWIKRPVKKGLCAVVQASFAGNIVVGFN